MSGYAGELRCAKQGRCDHLRIKQRGNELAAPAMALWFIKGVWTPDAFARLETNAKLVAQLLESAGLGVSVFSHERIHFLAWHLTDILPAILDREESQDMLYVLHLTV